MAKRYCDGCGRPLESHQTFCNAECAGKVRARVVDAALENPPPMKQMLQDKDLGDFLQQKYYGAGSMAAQLLKDYAEAEYTEAESPPEKPVSQ